MTTLLQRQLRPATFRGVFFFVEPQSGIALGGGRRVQVHEYPQRDKPYAQDLGRGARELEFEAFVVGENYIEQSKGLLAALETYGPGALVHPWLGEMTVNILNFRVIYDRELGHAKFQVRAVESGDLSFPSASTSTASTSRSAATSITERATSVFSDTFAMLGYVNRVAIGALQAYSRVLKFLGNPVGAIFGLYGQGTNGLLGNLSSLAGLFGQPIQLGWSFAGLLNISGKASSGELTAHATTAQQRDAIYLAMVRAHAAMAVNSALAPPLPTNSLSRSAIQQVANEAAINAHARQLLIANAVGLSSYVEGSIYDEVIAARVDVLAAIDAELLQITNDDLYAALREARSAVYADLTAKARDSARLITIDVPTITPGLAIAYDRHENPDRDGEIIARNHIRHPGFVPPGSLKVLSR